MGVVVTQRQHRRFHFHAPPKPRSGSQSRSAHPWKVTQPPLPPRVTPRPPIRVTPPPAMSPQLRQKVTCPPRPQWHTHLAVLGLDHICKTLPNGRLVPAAVQQANCLTGRLTTTNLNRRGCAVCTISCLLCCHTREQMYAGTYLLCLVLCLVAAAVVLAGPAAVQALRSHRRHHLC
jgi:hypothetical protein